MKDLYWVEAIIGNQTVSLTQKFNLDLIKVDEGDASVTSIKNSIAGLDGNLPVRNTFAAFPLTITFKLRAKDRYDYHLVKADLKSFLHQQEWYYIRHEKMPGRIFAVDDVSITNDRAGPITGTITLTFNCFRGYSESYGSTLDPFLFSTDKWAFGLHLPLGEDVSYTHTEKVFRIYNASDFTIDPRRRHKLDIALSCVGQPTITNYTTGDYFTYYKALKKSDILELNGVYPYKNGTHCGVDTNRGVITLGVGWNELEISGAENIKVSFDFPFLYR
ncbi:phage tail family protein [Listeria fleischmannii]|uniref:Siphovirus-type tail component RIFT-related domain-containing protein n=1 Tax=Listeria fleischmannii FSL S10-1203 TaxID=1265822 RepID=W7DJS0_9LIST|nr:phage tail family protein [Listeria fleischmannii]EUJ47644.1 hypothetical protein MCOL2_18029 [Listeria fleischmannii FSL S10-1203]